MSSPFQNKFISKSPLRSHERRLKKLDKKIAKADSYDAQGSKDYDYLADLQRQRKHLVESHNDPSTTRTEEEDTQVKEDEDAARASAIEMKSPLHGYVDASDMVDPNPPTAHMWGKVFDAASNAYREAITPKDPCAGLTGETLAKCRNANYEAKSNDNRENTSESEVESKKTGAYANLPDDYSNETHKAGFDKDNKKVLKDAEGNTYARYNNTTKQWVHLDDIPDFE